MGLDGWAGGVSEESGRVWQRGGGERSCCRGGFRQDGRRDERGRKVRFVSLLRLVYVFSTRPDLLMGL